MDRLHPLSLALAVGLLALGLAACEDAGAAPAARPSRVDAVKVRRKEPPKLEEFCDVLASGAEAPAFALPELEGAAPGPAKGWRWVNLWATWCKPCIEEMPLLTKWQRQLASDGHPVELLFLSVDESAEDVASWRAAHPGTPTGPRVADPQGLTAWLESIGLDAAAAIPIHVFVDGAGRRRCVRTGALSAHHYEAIAHLLSDAPGAD